jgi:hypothetical protein
MLIPTQPSKSFRNVVELKLEMKGLAPPVPVLLTVTLIAAEVVLRPCESVAIAVRTCDPFEAVVVFQVML